MKRDNPQSRQETIRMIKVRAKYEKIAIFPEGTCTNRSSIIKFRLGAFTPGLPVQPVYIDYEKNSRFLVIFCKFFFIAIYIKLIEFQLKTTASGLMRDLLLLNC